MVMVHERNADKIWQNLTEGLLEGTFPACITSVKMNLFDDRHKGDILEKIDVITRDFTKVDEVRHAEAVIIDLIHKTWFGIPTDCIRLMKYKPDLYTHVNIFKKNKFGGAVGGLRPTLYDSNYITRAGAPTAARSRIRNRVANPGRS